MAASAAGETAAGEDHRRGRMMRVNGEVRQDQYFDSLPADADNLEIGSFRQESLHDFALRGLRDS